MSVRKLSWAQFDVVNEDKRTAFEDLCRQLFKYTYFDRKTCFNANTNNPGIEIEPLYSEITKSRISYQIKYFDCSVKLLWKVSDAKPEWGYNPPADNVVDAFFNRFIGKSNANVSTVDVATGVTNTSGRVITAFEEATALSDAIPKVNYKIGIAEIIIVSIISVAAAAAIAITIKKRRTDK